MRWAVLVWVMAACEPETGVVHDGDTDVVLTEQTDGAVCATASEPTDDVVWRVPDGTVKLEQFECHKDYKSDPEPYACYLRNTLADVGEDGFLRFDCGSIDGEVSWRIDYTAPRP